VNVCSRPSSFLRVMLALWSPHGQSAQYEHTIALYTYPDFATHRETVQIDQI